MSLLDLSEVRAQAALALAPATDDDPDVHADIVDALVPPCLMLDWGNPWLTATSFDGSSWEARFVVWAVAGRVEPGPGIATLEWLIAYVKNRLQADPYPWPVATSVSPVRYEFGGVPYLSARFEYDVPVAVEAPADVPVLIGGSY